MKIILSTRNPSKAKQIKAMFTHPAIQLQTLSDAGIEGEAIEDGATLEENAEKKAQYALQRSDGNTWTIADDTGLFITALNGAPGVKAARWAGEDASTDDIMRYTLRQLEGAADRSAIFETSVVLLSPEGEKYTFNGQVKGYLHPEPKAAPQPQMPYTPLFAPDGADKVLAQMTVEEENAISNRGKAFKQAVSFLENRLKES